MTGVGWVNAELELRIWNCGARGNDLLLLLALSTFADRDTARCWPSISALCDRSGLNEKTVRAAITRLEQNGLLLVERRDRRPSRFTITAPTTPGLGTSNSGGSSRTTTPKNGSVYSQKRHQTTPGSGTRTSSSRTKATWTPKATRRDDPHDHHDDGNGYCPSCQERVDAVGGIA